MLHEQTSMAQLFIKCQLNAQMVINSCSGHLVGRFIIHFCLGSLHLLNTYDWVYIYKHFYREFERWNW